MPTFGDLLDQLNRQASDRDAGGAVEKCPKKKKPALFVMIGRSDNAAGASGVSVELTGPTKARQNSSGDGLAKFDPVKPGKYVLKFILTGDNEKKFLPAAAVTVSVAKRTTATHFQLLETYGTMEVKFIREDDNKPVAGVAVVVGTQAPITTDGTGCVTVPKLRSGTYKVRSKLTPTQSAIFSAPTIHEVFVGPGANAKLEIKLLLRKKITLRVILQDRLGAALPDKKWTLAAPFLAQGKTTADGLATATGFEDELESGHSTFSLVLPAPPPAAATAKPPAATPPAYPHIVWEGDYSDKVEPPVDWTKLEWDLQIAPLPAATTMPGGQARLQNLGFACTVGSDAPTTAAAVKAYQALHLKDAAGSGVLADIAADLEKRHDRP